MLKIFAQVMPRARPPGTLSAGASKCAVGELSLLMLFIGSGHHTPWAYYLIHTGSRVSAEVLQADSH
jgi:hypothetical protein